MSCNFIQVLGLEPMSRNQPSPTNQRPQFKGSWWRSKSQAWTWSSNALASEEKDLPLSVIGIPWKVTHDKHWCVSAIWLSSLQRFLNWGQLTELGKPRKCTVSINSLTGHLYSSDRSRALLPGCGGGWEGKLGSKMPIFSLLSEMGFFCWLWKILPEFQKVGIAGTAMLPFRTTKALL